MATLNEIPFSFLKEYSFILQATDHSDYRIKYPKENIFPENFDGTIGDFLDSEEMMRKYPKLTGKILYEGVSRNRNVCIKDYIIDLYDVVNSDVPFRIFRLNSSFSPTYRPAFYDTDLYDTWPLKDVFRIADPVSRSKMGLNLVPNHQYSKCLQFKVFQAVNDSDTLLQQIRSFINAYIEYCSLPYTGNASQPQIFKRRFKYSPFDNVVAELAELAQETGLTSEGVRINLVNSLAESLDLLLGSNADIYLAPSLRASMKKLNDIVSTYQIFRREDIREFIGEEVDEKTLFFVTSMFGLKHFQFGIFEPFYIKEEVQFKHVERLMQKTYEYFSKYPVGLTMRQIKYDLLKGVKAPLCDIVTRCVEISDCFFTKEVDGETVYFIKWHFLKKESDRIARILYETEGNALVLADIVKEYNSRCSRAVGEFSLISVDIKNGRKDLIEAVGKTGYWKLSTGTAASSRKFSSLADLIKQFLSTLDDDSEFEIDDLIAYLEKRGAANYNSKSLGTILNSIGYDKKVKGGTVYALSGSRKWSLRELIEAMANTLYQAPNRCMLQGKLIKAIKEQTGMHVNQGTFSNALKEAAGLFAIEKINSKRVLLKLVPDSVAEFDFSVFDQKRESPEYQSAIIQTAIDELLRMENCTLPLNELKAMVEHYVPGDIRSNIIYKIFEREDIFIKSDTLPKTISLDMALYKERYAKETSMFLTESEDTTHEQVIPHSFGFDWEQLKHLIICNLPDAFSSRPGLDKNAVLDKMYEIMQGGLIELTSENQFWKALDLWNRLYLCPTSCYERELLSTKLILGIENYLSNLLVMNNTDSGPDGLYDKVCKAQSVYLLPDRNYTHKINKLIGPLISTRNRYSHTNNEHHHGFTDIYKTIENCMRFYIYVAEYNL